MDVVAKNSRRVGPRYPQVLVLFGGTGDLSRRKLLPGLYHLTSAGFIPGCRIVGVARGDALTVPRLSKDLAAGIAGAAYAEIEAGAHAFILDEASQIAERMMPFLAAHPIAL